MLRLFVLAVAVILTGNALADIRVRVLDQDGSPVPGVVAYAQPPGANSVRAAADAVAVMDQVDTRFTPHVLVVQTGTLVEFPNSDTVAHHVYSFSHPNQFRLSLYKGDAHPPVRFEHPGRVTLGCNIHDNMLGFIMVVGTPNFSRTDATGVAILESTADERLEVTIWSPRIRDKSSDLVQTVTVPEAANAELTFRLGKTLRPPHDNQSEAITWAEY
jgi:plastocyanin